MTPILPLVTHCSTSSQNTIFTSINILKFIPFQQQIKSEKKSIPTKQKTNTDLTIMFCSLKLQNSSQKYYKPNLSIPKLELPIK